MRERLKQTDTSHGKYIKYILIALIALSALFILWGGASWLILKDVSGQIEEQTQYALTLAYQSQYHNGTKYVKSDYYNEFAETTGADIIKVKVGTTTHKIEGKWTFTRNGISHTIEEWIDLEVIAKASSNGTLEPIIWQGSATFETNPLDDSIITFWGLTSNKKTFTFNDVTLQLPQLIAVAKCGNNYYATLDAAIQKGSGTIYALTAGNNLAQAQKAKTLTQNISSGKTLYVCYDDTVFNNYTLDNTTKSATNTCTNAIYVGKSITNNGTITVPAVITGLQKNLTNTKGTPEYGPDKGTSRVYGKYAMIKCIDEGAITSNTTIHCYGYIEGNVTLQGGRMNVLFSFMDHRGGSALTKMYMNKALNSYFPIRRYYIAAVHGNLTIQHGATLVSTAQIYINEDLSDSVELVGSTSNAFVQLNKSTGSYVTIHYDANKTLEDGSNNPDYGKNKVDIYGSASLNDINVSVTVDIGELLGDSAGGLGGILGGIMGGPQTITMSTANGAVPIPYLWEIGLHPKGASTVVNTAGKTKLALFPGAKCVIDKGVTFKANSIAIYTAAHASQITAGAGYYVEEDAQLIVNGTLEAADKTLVIGGPVTTQTEGAKIAYTGNTLTTKTATSDSSITDLTHNLTLNTLTSNTPSVELKTNPVAGTYNSSEYTTDSYAWYPSGTISVTLNANGGCFDNNTSITSKAHSVAAGTAISNFIEPTREGYTFSHWCNTSDPCSHTDNVYDMVYFTGDTLYAKWSEQTYDIEFKYVVNGVLQPNYQGVPQKLSFTTSQLPSLVLSEVVGEYPYTDSSGNAYRSIGFYTSTNSSGLLPNGIPLTLYYYDAIVQAGGVIYVYWTSSEYTVTFNLGNVPSSYGFGTTEAIEVDKVPLGFVPSELSALEGIYTKSADRTDTYLQYIEGWYLDAECTNKYTITHNPGGNYTLYAKWADKAQVTIDYGTGDPNNYSDRSNIRVIPGESILITDYIENVTAKDFTNTVSKYFTGWTTDSNSTLTGNRLTVNNSTTLSATWGDKVSLQFTADENVYSDLLVVVDNKDGSSDALAYGTTYYYYPGQEITLPNVKKNNEYAYADENKTKYFASWTLNGNEFDDTYANGIFTLSESATIAIDWETKLAATFKNGNTTVATIYCIPGKTLTTPKGPDKPWTLSSDKNSAEMATFMCWSDGTTSIFDNYTMPAQAVILTPEWNTPETYYKVTITLNNAEIKSCEGAFKNEAGDDVDITQAGTYYATGTFQIDVTYTESDSKTLTVNGTNLGSATTWSSGGDLTGTVTISASSKNNCIAAGTLITLADGTQKKVEDLTVDDVLLVFNHETGKYEAAGIIFIENDGWNYYNVINLTFSNGTTTKLIYEHALFDLTLNKYVYITEFNYADFVGHEFAVQSGDTFERVTLIEAYVAEEYTGCYSLVTVYHLNYFIDGLFSIPGGITGLFNFFEYGDDLVYDAEKMQADIEKYGLFTYEDFAEYMPYELYAAFPAPYLKVAIGKGMITFDDLLGYIDQFLVKNGLM